MWHKVCNIESYVILLLNHLVKLINHKLLIDIFFLGREKAMVFLLQIKRVAKS